jgi:WhiB family redox-sensing transcriptional regulator
VTGPNHTHHQRRIARIDWSWIDGREACRDTPVEMVPTDLRGVEAAKQVCEPCPLKRPCLEAALSVPRDDDYGVWGGTSRRERDRMARRRR